MKKLLLISAFALVFIIFSCTPDEYETQQKKNTEKTIDHGKPTRADEGPGDEGPKPPPPPPTDT